MTYVHRWLQVVALILVSVALASAQNFIRLQPKFATDTISADGDAMVFTTADIGTFGSVKVQTLDSYTGTWEVQCSVNGTTFDTDNELKLTAADSTSTVYDVSDEIGIWDVTNAAACRSIRVIATAGFAASDTAVVISAIQSGGGSSGGGGGGGAVTVTDGSDTALVSAGGELLVSCADCSGSGVSHVDDAAFTVGTDDVVPAAGIYRSTLDSLNDGDAGAIAITSNRILMTHIVDASGVAATLGGGTQYTEGDTDATITGTAMLVEGAGNALVVAPGTAADGLLVNLGTNNDVVVTNAGTFAAQVTAISAGNNNIGDVDVASIAAGTNNIGDVDVASIAAGDNDIGNVDLEIAGTAIAVNNGAASAQTLRVTVANDSTGVIGVTGAALTALQLIDNPVQADDAAFTLGSSSVMMAGAIRDDALSTLTAVEGDAVPLRVSSTGALFVTGSSGVTEFAEDTAHSTGAAGNLALAVRNDAGTALAGDGDYIPLMVNASGALIVTGGGGGTEYVVNAVAPADPTGSALLAERDDALATVTEADADWTNLRTNARGALWVELDQTNVVTVALSATDNAVLDDIADGITVALGATDNAVLDDIADGIAVTQSGTWNIGTTTTVSTVTTVGNISQIGGVNFPVEDAGETVAGTGIYAMSVRRDTAASSAGTTGDNATLNTDATGRMWVTGTTNEDTASANLDQGHAVFAIRDDTLDVRSGTEGDYEPLHTNANGALWTIDVNSASSLTAVQNTATAVQLLDNAVFADDAAFTLASSSVHMAGAIRDDALSTLTAVEGDAVPLRVSSTGALHVTGGTGTTQYTEDAAATDGAALVAMGGIRRDTTPSSSAGTAGDNATITLDGNGRLYTNAVIYDADGAAATLAVDYTQDAALTVGTTTGPMEMGRASAAAPTNVSADGDAVMAWRLLNGSAVSNLAAGGTLITATSNSLNVACTDGCSGGTQYAEDDPTANGHLATMAGVVRLDTRGTGIGASGDVTFLSVNSTGDLYTTTLGAAGHDSVAGSVAPLLMGGYASQAAPTDVSADGDATRLWVLRNGSPVANLAAGGTLITATSAALNVASVGTIAHDAADSGAPLKVGGYASTTPPTAVAAADRVNAWYTLNGAAAMVPAGASVHYRTSAAATEDEHEIKATAGTLYSVLITNTNASARYIRCYNLTAANTTPGTSTVFWGAAIPGATTGAGFVIPFPAGLTFDTALTCAFTTGAADTDVAEVAANEIKATYTYR